MQGNLSVETQVLKGNISTKGDLKGTISGKSSLSGSLNNKVVETGNYNNLTNKPQINDVTLIGNLSLEELDIQKTMERLSNTEIERLIGD